MPHYIVDIEVHHRIEVDAESAEEAEELAYDEYVATRIAYNEVAIYAVEEPD